jgi:hypothetical protein
MRAALARIALYSLGISIVVLSAAGYSVGQDRVAPEIDPSSISAGVGLLTAGLLILRARRSK